MTRNAFYKMLEKAARKACLEGVHPHLLRHGCGFKLVNDGMDTLSLAAYLGHRRLATLILAATRRWRRLDLRICGGIKARSRNGGQ